MADNFLETPIEFLKGVGRACQPSATLSLTSEHTKESNNRNGR
jgi:hypothetical protein